MDIQQIIALMIVAVAAVYLGRNAWRAWQAFRSGKGGCESGCGKCAFAVKELRGRKPSITSSALNIIPLSESKPASKKRPH